jgi:predicted nuclease of predicted toxin-antitoxin system
MLKLYMDHHIPRAITVGLRMRGIDVVTAYEDNAHEFEDSDLLSRATELKRVLFSQDDDLLVEAQRRQHHGMSFYGVLFAQQGSVSIGQCVKDLELLSILGEEKDVENQVIYLPL